MKITAKALYREYHYSKIDNWNLISSPKSFFKEHNTLWHIKNEKHRLNQHQIILINFTSKYD